MTLWFVHRRADGAIASAHQVEHLDAQGRPVNPMPDYLDGEALDDATSVELQAFLKPIPAAAVLDAAALAATLIAKGVVTQADVNAAMKAETAPPATP